MQKWEYLETYVMHDDVFINDRADRRWRGKYHELMNQLGEEGWEAVGIGNYDKILFKRPKE